MKWIYRSVSHILRRLSAQNVLYSHGIRMTNKHPVFNTTEMQYEPLEKFVVERFKDNS